MLRAYLEAWFPILLSRFPGVTFLDGFAGPGEYTNGEPGSPLVALDVVLHHAHLGLGKPIRFGFIEADEQRHAHLEQLLQARVSAPPANVVIHPPRCGRFQEIGMQVLDDLGAWNEPIFANLDAWGADVPFPVVQRLAGNVATEVLITFTSGYFRRFAGSDVNMPKADAQFGPVEWRGVKDEITEAGKKRFLVEVYRETLVAAGFSHTLFFEMLDDDGHEMFLVFATTNTLGVDRMKKAMWEVDPEHGVRFRDPRDVNQVELLVREPDLAPLRRQLLDYLVGGGWHKVEDVRRYVLLETIYRPTALTPILRELRDADRLEHQPGRRITTAGQVRLLD